MDIKVIIQDPLGVRTGIAISDTYYYIEKKTDRIRIYGTMTENHGAVSTLAEPEILCCFKDADDRILFCAKSGHSGCFLRNKSAVFSIEIVEVSKKCDWDMLSKIVLSLIFT